MSLVCLKTGLTEPRVSYPSLLAAVQQGVTFLLMRGDKRYRVEEEGTGTWGVGGQRLAGCLTALIIPARFHKMSASTMRAIGFRTQA